ncbi:MAG: autotransporter assembly complex protein TamA [Alphaproteobacteria bacterium]|nr:autotransporter assembly complex protein TamA [Alphaproteobacteria bacterium]
MGKEGAGDRDQATPARRGLHVALGLLLTFWTAVALSQEDRGAPVDENGETAPEEASANTDLEAAERFAYEVVFENLSQGRTKEILEQIAETQRLADQPPTSFSRLRRRAEGDVPRLVQALRARGFYRAAVTLDIDRTTSPITITYTFDAGPIYEIGKVTIELTPPTEDDIDLPSPKKLNLRKGKRASSIKVIEAETELLQRVKKQGFANAVLGDRTVIVDHDTAKMDITFRLNPGPKIYFGETTVVGNEEVEARFLRRLLEWKPGKLVTPERLQTTQLNLIETGLFNSVRIEPGKKPDDQGRVPIKILIKEAKHRTIEAGIRYRTDEGIGGSLGWEHRNLLGTGEQLGFELDGSEIGWHLRGEAREPDFLRRRQALVIGAEIAVENTDAFESQSIGASIGIERSVGDGMELAAGVAFRASEVEQDGDTEGFGLLSLPASFSWDHSNNLLDPSRGGRLSIQNEPFVDVFGNDVAFNKTTVAYSRYQRVRKENPRLILAARTKAGFLFGTQRDNVPADERFYAGGGGSVRGFGFQLAGELDDDDDPIGGRSLFEVAGELRSQFTDTIGAALFVDSGAAFGSTVPDFEEDLRVGAGGGLRYFSPVGPIRLDVGFPLNGRDSDAAFQIYVSIGQAF